VLDKKNQAYINLILKLMEEKYSGKIIINLLEGGVTGLSKRFEPEPPIVLEESVRLKR